MTRSGRQELKEGNAAEWERKARQDRARRRRGCRRANGANANGRPYPSAVNKHTSHGQTLCTEITTVLIPLLSVVMAHGWTVDIPLIDLVHFKRRISSFCQSGLGVRRSCHFQPVIETEWREEERGRVCLFVCMCLLQKKTRNCNCFLLQIPL